MVVKVNTVNFQGQKDVTIDVEFDKPFPAEVQLTSTATFAPTWSSIPVRCISMLHRAVPPSSE